MFKWAVFLCAWIVFFSSSGFGMGLGESLGLDPRWNWQTLETQHFRVTYPQEMEELAMRSGELFEEAHILLAPRLAWEPRYKVQIVLVDNTDAANGLTTAVLRFGIVLMVTPPEDWYSTGYYDDWLRLLVIHEYTHFLNMDATFGVWAGLRMVIGDVLLPNAMWPSWMMEGLAVYMETQLTRSGRGRSSYYEMVLRSAVEEGRLDTADGVTLDRLTGPSPWFPGGEIQYLYGYQLMNQVANHLSGSASAAGLGEISRRSAWRVPYFINGNLQNITGKTWYQTWDDWVTQTRVRMSAQLEQLRHTPLSKVEKLSFDGWEALGLALSPDGKWLAFTADSLDRRMGLYLLDLSSGQAKRLTDKAYGAKIAFTSDSRAIIFSALQRQNNHSFFSDLAVWDLEDSSMRWLSQGLRARDPAISSDGKRIVFTLTQDASVGVAVAPLLRAENGEYKIGPVESVYRPSRFDRAATPVFLDSEGKKVVFSLHPNGVFGQSLVAWDWTKPDRPLETLVSAEHFNRHPAVTPAGELYFVSDRTGVDNLYHFRRDGKSPELVSHVLTGVSFPAFGPSFGNNERVAYLNIFDSSGWKPARLTLADPIDSSKVVVSAPPAPRPEVAEKQPVDRSGWAIGEYSIFPSILPRQWAPFLAVKNDSVYFGGEILGFDAIDRHRYVLSGAFDTQTAKPDVLLEYVNRAFGPTLSVSAENTTSSVTQAGSNLYFQRRTRLEFAVEQPLLATYSVWTGEVTLKADRTLLHRKNLDTTEEQVVSSSRYVPIADAAIGYSESDGSRLAISQEGGRQAFGGVRGYFDPDQSSWKYLLMDREYIRVTDHSIAIPSLKASWVNQVNTHYFSANVVAEGRTTAIADGLPDDSFDQLAIRGYPKMAFFSRAAMTGALEYRFPLLRLYRGAGTYPVFFENVSAFVVGESTWFPAKNDDFGVRSLPAVGAGLRINMQMFNHIPLDWVVEYDRGFREEVGGQGELYLALGTKLLDF